jgi:hypothetical protein
MMGRILITNAGSLGVTVILSVVTGVVELALRLTVKWRDDFIARKFGKVSSVKSLDTLAAFGNEN